MTNRTREYFFRKKHGLSEEGKARYRSINERMQGRKYGFGRMAIVMHGISFWNGNSFKVPPVHY